MKWTSIVLVVAFLIASACTSLRIARDCKPVEGLDGTFVCKMGG